MKLERGINLGGYLSQCVHSTEHYDAFIQEEDIRKIASMGFDHVRLAIDYEVLEDEYGRTREEGFAYVTRVVEWCKRQGLNIVLDLHKAYGYDFNNAGDQKKNILFTNKMVQKRFVNLWIKIAEHYANETHVAFELLNEVVEQENAEAWNLLIAETVDAIRRIARDTIIIYGGIQWNSVKTLKLLEIKILEIVFVIAICPIAKSDNHRFVTIRSKPEFSVLPRLLMEFQIPFTTNFFIAINETLFRLIFNSGVYFLYM